MSRSSSGNLALAAWLMMASVFAGCETEIAGQPVPIAVAGADAFARLGGDPIVLDATGSHLAGDPATAPDAFLWQVVVSPAGDGSGPSAVLADPEAAVTSLEVGAPGLYVIRLDAYYQGRAGRPAYVNVRARHVPVPPVAVAGADQEVDPRADVTLDGSGSFAPDGGDLNFAWTQVGGPDVTLAGTAGPSPTFQAPRASGPLTFALVVTDERGLTSEEDRVTITVRSLPPVAVIQAPSAVDETDVVILDGRFSNDPNNDVIVGWSWTASWPGGPIMVTNANNNVASFQAPRIAGSVPPVTVTLSVTNDADQTGVATHTVSIRDVINDPPVADAGADRAVGELQALLLDATGSDDPNGDALTYAWSYDDDGSGPPITLLDADTAQAAFVTPRVDEATPLTFTVEVDDGRGLTDTDSVTITVEKTIVDLVITDQPPAAVETGTPFSITVDVHDVDGNRPAGADDEITLALQDPGAATLGGVLTRPAVDGRAVFTGLSVGGVASGLRIVASSPRLNGATSDAFDVIPGPLDRLVVTDQPPPSSVAGTTFGVTITALDTEGNVSESFSGEITVSLLGGDGATLAGTTTVSAASGVAVFDDLWVDRAAAGYRLQAETAGVAPVETDPFAIVPAAATALSVSVQPPAAPTADETFGFTVTAIDEYGNVDPNFDATVSITLDAGPDGGNLSGPLTADADQGTAVFEGLSLDRVGTYVIEAGAAGVMSALTDSIELQPGAPAVIVLVDEPDAPVTAGAVFTVAAEVHDAAGNLVDDFDGEVVVAVASGPADGALSGTVAQDADGGVVTFDGLWLDRVGEYVLGVATGSIGPEPTGTITVEHAEADRLAVVSHPAAVSANEPFGLVVEIWDAYGNRVEDANDAVSVEIAVGPDGATLSGEDLTVTADAGVATFTGLSLDEEGSYRLRATSGTLEPGLSGTFQVLLRPPTHLVLAEQPADLVAGVPFALVVEAHDETDEVAVEFTGEITLRIDDYQGPSQGTLGGVLTVNAVEGVATFEGLSLDRVGSYVLEAFADGDGLTPATTDPIPVAPAEPARLVLVTPPHEMVAGACASPITVEVQDAFGNPSPVAADTVVSLGSSSGTTVFRRDEACGGPTVTTKTIASGGTEATFSFRETTAGPVTVTVTAADLDPDEQTHTVHPGAPDRIVFVSDPHTVVAGACSGAVDLAILDEFGNVVPSDGDAAVALTASSPTLAFYPDDACAAGTEITGLVIGDGTGEARFHFRDTRAGTPTVTADPDGLPPEEQTQTVEPGAPVAVVIVTQPDAPVVSGALFEVVAGIHDDFGNVVEDYADDVSIAIATGPDGGTLTGVTPLTPVAGVAAFDVSLDVAGEYVLTISSGALTSDDTDPLTVVAGPPTHLVLVEAPADLYAGEVFTLVAEARDGSGNVVDGYAGEVTVTILSGPGDGVLEGTLTVAAMDGVVTFDDLYVNRVGDYIFEVDADGLDPDVTGTIPVVSGPADRLVLTEQPVAPVTAGAVFTLIAEVQDAYGNVIEDHLADVVAAIFSGPADGQLLGTTAVSPTGGVAELGDLSIERAGEYVLSVDTDGVDPELTDPVVVAPAAAVRLVHAPVPSGVIAGQTFTHMVEIHDDFGNVVTDATDEVTLGVDSGPPDHVLFGTLSRSAASGVATFDDLSVEVAGDYVFDATAAGLAPGLSDVMTVGHAPAVEVVVDAHPDTVDAGAPFTVVAHVRDAFGNLATTYGDDVSIFVRSGPGVLLGTLVISPLDGVATFDDLGLETVGDHVLRVASGGLDDGDTGTIVVGPGPATTIVIAAHPSQVVIDQAFTVVAEIHDDYGNLVTGAGDDLTISKAPAGQGGGPGNLGGTLTVAAVDGVATFDDLTLDALGDHRLRVRGDGLTEALTGVIEVVEVTATHLVVVVQPPPTVDAGEAFAVTVEARTDENVVHTGFEGEVTIAIATGPGDGVLSGPALTVSAVEGVASFTGLWLNRVGTYTLEVTAVDLVPDQTDPVLVEPGEPAQLTIVTAAHTVDAGDCATPLVVQVQDGFGNPSPVAAPLTVTLGADPATLTFWASANCGPPGQAEDETVVPAGETDAEFSFRTTVAGAPLVLVDAAGLDGDQQIQTVRPLPADRVAFVTAPHSVEAGACSGLLVLESQDEYGNRSPVTEALTISLASDSATLGFSTDAECAGATAILDVEIPAEEAEVAFRFLDTTAGTPEILASPAGMAPVDQVQAVTAGAATRLSVATQPPETVTAGAEFTVVIEAQDDFGNVDPGYAADVTVDFAPGGNPGDATLGGTLLVPATDGIASFTDLVIDVAELGYVLRFESGTFDPADSDPFDVSAPSATRIVVTVQPPDPASLGSPFTVVAEAQDDAGNRDPSFDGAVSIAIEINPTGASLSGTTGTFAVDGVITFADLALDRPGEGFVLRVTDAAAVLLSGDTDPFDVTAFEGGSGTLADPYQIANVYQLQAGIAELDAHYVLVDDIDASETQTWDGGQGFVPIGDDDDAFTGTFDGQGHTITGLFIDRTGQRGYGLFGYTDSNAVIENVCVLDVDITGTREVGAIAGRTRSNTVVRRTCSSGRVEATDEHVGGLVGWNDGDRIEDSYARTDVFVGNRRGGGLVGQNDSPILRSYATGFVQDANDTGGLTGRGGGATVDAFWDVEASGRADSNSGTGKTTEEMKDVRTFTDVAWSDGLTAAWDFVDDPFDDTGTGDVWNLDSNRIVNDGYPVLEVVDNLGPGAFTLVTLEMIVIGDGTVDPAPGVHTHTQNMTLTLTATPDTGWKFMGWTGDVAEPTLETTTITLNVSKIVEATFEPLFAGGDGSAGNPYQIQDVHDLQGMQLDLAANYVIINDFDASLSATWNGGAGFEPVGTDGTRFTGALDGQGHVIYGLFIDRADRAASLGTGLFGYLGGTAAVRNLCLKDVQITGDENVGALVGRTRVVTTALDQVCATGTVTGRRAVGGLVGRHAGAMADAYARVAVTGTDREVGGLIGRTEGGNTNRTYSTGAVAGTTTDIGGLIGRTGGGATTLSSYWDTETSGQATSAGGEGRTTEEMKTESNYTLWDFTDVWNLDATEAIAEGYPHLRVIWE